MTLTVTEKGYRLDPVRALADGPPLAVLSCDNLSRNGRRLASVVDGALDLVPAPVAARARAWVDRNVACARRRRPGRAGG